MSYEDDANFYYEDDSCLPTAISEVWTTKDGVIVLIQDMTDKHLLNAFKKFRNTSLGNEILIRLFERAIYNGS